MTLSGRPAAFGFPWEIRTIESNTQNRFPLRRWCLVSAEAWQKSWGLWEGKYRSVICWQPSKTDPFVSA